MALSPPKEALWWKLPVSKAELTWIIIAFSWGLFMFFFMIYWHGAGKQNLSNEAYRISAEDFSAKTKTMVDKYTVRQYETKIGTKIPVVHPPAGEDVYLIARLWQWWPMLELEKNKSYRLHISSMDWMHGFSLQPVNINIEVHPDYEIVLTMTPDTSGEFTIVCNEYCGIGHHTMLGKIFVTENN